MSAPEYPTDVDGRPLWVRYTGRWSIDSVTPRRVESWSTPSNPVVRSRAGNDNRITLGAAEWEPCAAPAAARATNPAVSRTSWEIGNEIEIGFPQEDFCQEDAVEIRTKAGETICYAVCDEATRNMLVATPDLLAACMAEAATLEAEADALMRPPHRNSGESQDRRDRAAALRAAIARATGSAR